MVPMFLFSLLMFMAGRYSVWDAQGWAWILFGIVAVTALIIFVFDVADL